MRLFDEVGAAFLQPKKVGSSVRWNVTLEQNTYKDKLQKATSDTEVSLTDCTRVITWSGYGKSGIDDMLIKVDAALAEFKAFRKALVQAKKIKVSVDKNVEDGEDDDED